MVHSGLSTGNMAMGKFSVIKETLAVTGSLTSIQRTFNNNRAQRLHSKSLAKEASQVIQSNTTETHANQRLRLQVVIKPGAVAVSDN